MSQPTNSPGRPRKVSRLIEKYGLDTLGTELENHWLGRDDSPEGLRSVADRFNRELLRKTVAQAGMDLTPEEIETVYNILTDQDVSSGTRNQIERRLARNGIEVEEVEGDFVSRQAIHTYLTKDRGVNRDTDLPALDQESAAIGRLLSRTEAVAEDKLNRLSEQGRITLGEALVSADLTVTCLDCGVQLTLDDLVQNEGCECDPD